MAKWTEDGTGILWQAMREKYPEFSITTDQFGTWYRGCRYCGFTATYSDITTIDLTPCSCGKPDLAFTPGFVPVDTDRYSFSHRGVSLDLFLVDGEWLVGWSGFGISATISADTTALDMREILIAIIEENAPAYMLLPEGRTELDWISAIAKNSAQPRPIPFEGELDADDAQDTAPGCYGL